MSRAKTIEVDGKEYVSFSSYKGLKTKYLNQLGLYEDKIERDAPKVELVDFYEMWMSEIERLSATEYNPCDYDSVIDTTRSARIQDFNEKANSILSTFREIRDLLH